MLTNYVGQRKKMEVDLSPQIWMCDGFLLHLIEFRSQTINFQFFSELWHFISLYINSSYYLLIRVHGKTEQSQ